MAVDTPARIAILGAGPVGLEAALYARFLGYDVDLYERGRIGEHLLRWAQVRFHAPWHAIRSTLALAALRAQDPSWRSPDEEALLTGRDLVGNYYLPLAQSDLLGDSLRLGCEVLAVSREGLVREDFRDDKEDSRENYPFRVLFRDAQGAEQRALADVVIDATGMLGQPRGLGPGGISLPSERELEGKIDYGLPDILGSDRARFAGRHSLLFGHGCSARANAAALGELAAQAPNTSTTWIRPGESTVESLVWDEVGQALQVEIGGKHAGTGRFDAILANLGYRADERIYAELQSERAARAVGATGPERLLRAEPDFYILGAKSCARLGDFSMALGFAQIRDLFTILGDRASLDLYANMPPPA